MSQDLITGTAIFDDKGALVGTVMDVEIDAEKVGILTEAGNHLWVPKPLLTYRDQRWTLAAGYTQTSPAEVEAQQQERELDKTSADSFPASDPPSFTMGDEGKGS